jgi:predicted membrane-bound spermidine synthase
MKQTLPTGINGIWCLCGGIFWISFSVIAFEITLARLLSVILSHHYVFIILSLTMLGLGLGSMGVEVLKRRLPSGPSHLLMALIACLFALSLPLSVILITTFGYPSTVKNAFLFYFPILIIPFVLVGILFSYLFRLYPHLSGKLYAADLLGGAIGAVGVISILNLFGGISTGILLGLGASSAAMLFCVHGEMHYRLMAVSVAVFLAIASLSIMHLSGIYTPSIELGKNPHKEIHDALSEFHGKIIRTKWSAFGRTDLLAFEGISDHMDLYLDGTAGSPMYRFTGSVRSPGDAAKNLKQNFVGYFPFLSLRENERRNALIIGAGGGRDILLALMGGVRKITAVEVNRDLVELVAGFSDFNGGIYAGREDVHVIVEEGRHFLRRNHDKYDIIMLSLPVTNTSRSLEGYSLTENFLFTVNSIKDYLANLTEKGRLIVVAHNDMEALRLLTTSLNAFEDDGLKTTDAMKHIYLVASEDYLVFVLKKTPFTREDSAVRYGAMRHLPLDSQSSYFPHIRIPGAVNPALVSLASGGIEKERLIEMVRERGYEISPVTDDSPFFYKFDVGTPWAVATAFWGSLLLLCCMVVFSFFFSKRRLRGMTSREERLPSFRLVLVWNTLFLMTGTGFMTAEICMIQKFVLFLGNPVVCLAVLLFSLLIGAGAGSYVSSRVATKSIRKGIRLPSIVVTLMILVYIPLLPWLFTQFLGLPASVRFGISFALLMPLAFFMGFPFPLGIRLLKESNGAHHVPWAWGLNGVSSVFGSALTVATAIHYGYTEALLLAALCYFAIFITFSGRP